MENLSCSLQLARFDRPMYWLLVDLDDLVNYEKWKQTQT